MALAPLAPPIPDWEIWACAHELIRKHGEDAPIHAALRADKLLWQGALEGAATWRLIGRRTIELLTKPAVTH